jgi:phospholipid-binding lipoprotein MlaA
VSRPRILVRLAAATAALALGGCAHLAGAGIEGPASGSPARSKVDPFEPVNRAIFSLNETVDDIVTRPIATAYARYVPEVFQLLAGNFLWHLRDPYIAANSLLQGKPADAAAGMTRFALNTVFGFFGVADPASEMGFERGQEDFGQTLGVWGFGTGPYLVLPIFGPSNFRDGVGFAVDNYAAVIKRHEDVSVRNSLVALELVDNRARLLPAQRLLDEALDRYLLVRDSYLQRRRNLVHDGNPPEEE